MAAVPSSVRRLRLILAVLTGVLCLLGASDNAARIDRLGHQMMCVCGNCAQTLLECNHVGCAYSTRMRSELTAAVERGDPDDTVLQFFIQEYGTTVLAVPTNQGFSRLAWIMPYAALGAGISLVVLIAWAWKRRSVPVQRNVVVAGGPDELDRFREQARRETRL
jgi:cytochrome c-type biogenesis protein CcmH